MCQWGNFAGSPTVGASRTTAAGVQSALGGFDIVAPGGTRPQLSRLTTTQAHWKMLLRGRCNNPAALVLASSECTMRDQQRLAVRPMNQTVRSADHSNAAFSAVQLNRYSAPIPTAAPCLDAFGVDLP